MLKRKLGQQGLTRIRSRAGVHGMSWAYGTPDEAEAVATIHRALELGIDFFDTAEVYGPFENEKLLSRRRSRAARRRDHRHEVGFKTRMGRSPATTAGPSMSRRRPRGR